MAQWNSTIPLTTGAPVIPVILDQNVGFQARSVLVDNYTAYWLYIRTADSFIPPYWIGAILQLTHQTDWVYIELKTPFGVDQIANPPTGPSYLVRSIWSDEQNVVAGSGLPGAGNLVTGGVAGAGGGGGLGGSKTGISIQGTGGSTLLPPLNVNVNPPPVINVIGTATNTPTGSSSISMLFAGNTYAGGADVAPGIPMILLHNAAFQFPTNKDGACVIFCGMACVAKVGALSGMVAVYIDGIPLVTGVTLSSPKGVASISQALSKTSFVPLPTGVHDVRIELSTLNANTLSANTWWFVIDAYSVL